jgi:hypothetical protein
MAILNPPLPAHAEARALLHHLLEHGDLVGKDSAGRTVIKLAVDDWALERLMAFDADAAELEDQGEDEPDADDEVDGPPVVRELARPRGIRRGQAMAPSVRSGRLSHGT